MSRRNTLENKKIRREERAAHAIKMDKQRRLQARMEYLAYAPPNTFEELEGEVNKITDEANTEGDYKPCLPVTCPPEQTEWL